MGREGKYIYCIIGTEVEKNFGPVGIGERGAEVTTLCHRDIGMVISNHPLIKLVVNRENTLAHERVVEEVMKEFTVLPVRFCTIASEIDEIKNLLAKRYGEFKDLLRKMDHKIELSVKGLWKDMGIIYDEIRKENLEIKRWEDKIQKDTGKGNIQEKISVGMLVEEALLRKKGKEAEKIIEAMWKITACYKHNTTIGNEMFINAAFLVDRGREREFDNRMDELSEEYKERIKFLYAGPFPPYNFANIIIYPEEWGMASHPLCNRQAMDQKVY